MKTTGADEQYADGRIEGTGKCFFFLFPNFILISVFVVVSRPVKIEHKRKKNVINARPEYLKTKITQHLQAIIPQLKI